MAKKSRVAEKNNKDQQQQIKDQKHKKQQKFSLYVFLQIDKTATLQQIKKQYRKLVLKYHPDKNKQDPDAREKFQKLKQAFDILSDPEKRKTYDQTGSTGQEQFDQNTFQSAYEYFRNMYKKVTKQDIEQFQKKYRFGQQQKQDLIQYYQQHQGNMIQLIESIPLSKNQDIPRFIQFFEQQIKAKQIPKYNAFQKTKNKVRLLQDQTQQFNEQQKKQSTNQLILAIRNKNKNHHLDFIAALEEKYGGKKTKTNKQHLPKVEKPQKIKKVHKK